MANFVKSLKRLDLATAIKNDRLGEFVAQEEARGIGPADKDYLMKNINKLIGKPVAPKGDN